MKYQQIKEKKSTHKFPQPKTFQNEYLPTHNPSF